MSIDQFCDELKGCYADLFGDGPYVLHRPIFSGNEKKYLNRCIDSNFVSSASSLSTEFENAIASYTGVQFAVSTVNATTGLHAALVALGVEANDLVVTQALTFAATANAIRHSGAEPIFIDVDKDTLGLSPISLLDYLQSNTYQVDGVCIEKSSKKKIAACIPMHTFGNFCRIRELAEICRQFNVPLLEDAAEALGSKLNGHSIGQNSRAAILSFNGNKIITTGGGGMVLTNNSDYCLRLRHLVTTAKVHHPFEFIHDELGYNYRMPGLNAALGLAQLEKIDRILAAKEILYDSIASICDSYGVELVTSIAGSKSNNWLISFLTQGRKQRDYVLSRLHALEIFARPIWRPLNRLPYLSNYTSCGLSNTDYLYDRVISLPSSAAEQLV